MPAPRRNSTESRDHRHALVERRAERLEHVVVPRLADDAHGADVRLDEVAQGVVAVDLALHAPRRPERDERGRRELHLLRRAPEELVVLGVRAGPARLDVVDAEPVELLGDPQLVLDGQRDPLELRPVAQRRVIDLDAAGRRELGSSLVPVVSRHAHTILCTCRPGRGPPWRIRSAMTFVIGPGHGITRSSTEFTALDLGRGAAHEHLLGDVEVAAREFVDRDLEAVVAGDRHHRVLRDARQRARRDRRRDQHAATRREDVLAGALGHEAVGVQHDRFVVAGLQRLDLGQRRVHVVAGRLRQRRHRVVVVARPRRDLHAHALADRVVAEVRAPRPARDRHVDLARQRVEPHLAVAVVRDRPDVARRQTRSSARCPSPPARSRRPCTGSPSS